jgi:hypothetical protein
VRLALHKRDLDTALRQHDGGCHAGNAATDNHDAIPGLCMLASARCRQV